MKRNPILKIEISCQVLPDGSLGNFSISESAGQRSGYSLKNPFDSPCWKYADRLMAETFKRDEGSAGASEVRP